MDWTAEITAAAARIAPYIRRTPVMQASLAGLDHPLQLKLEQTQHTGSFKARGAFNSLLSLPVPAAGVVAASGGNHGAAVAWAAAALGVDVGLVARLVGCHVYLGPAADGGGNAGSPAVAGSGANPLVPGGDPAAYAVRFTELWAELSGQLRDELDALDALPLADLVGDRVLDQDRQHDALDADQLPPLRALTRRL